MEKKPLRHKIIHKLAWNKFGAFLSRCLEGVIGRIETTVRNFSIISGSNGEYWIVGQIDESPNVVDVGFHKGEFSEMVLKQRPSASIVGIDASKKSKKYHDESGLKEKVKLKNLAVSNFEGEGQFYEYGNSLNSLSERVDYEDLDEVITTEVSTIDKLCNEEGIKCIDLLKIDAEGHDVSVIEGANRMMEEESIKIIMFEFSSAWISSGNYLADVVKILSDMNYEIFRLFDGFLNEFEYDIDYDCCTKRGGMYVIVEKSYLEENRINTKNLEFI